MQRSRSGSEFLDAVVARVGYEQAALTVDRQAFGGIELAWLCARATQCGLQIASWRQLEDPTGAPIGNVHGASRANRDTLWR